MTMCADASASIAIGCKLRRMREDEVAAAHQLAIACFDDRANSDAFIRHRYFDRMGPTVFVIVAEIDGRLAGQQAATILPFMVDGQDTTVCMFTDGMTHPDYRGRGVFRRLLDETAHQAFDAGAVALFTMPNDLSLPAFAKSKQWQVLAERRLYARVVDGAALLRDWKTPSLVSRALGAVLERKIPQADDRMQCTEIASLCELAQDVDTLAQTTQKQWPGVVCRRDYAFLQWRYESNPTYRYRYFIAREPKGRLRALAVTLTEHRMGTRISYIIDLVCAPNDVAGGELVGHVAKVMRSDDVRIVGAIVSSSVIERQLLRAGLRPAPSWLIRRRFHAACAVRPDVASKFPSLCRQNGWHFTLADFDTI